MTPRVLPLVALLPLVVLVLSCANQGSTLLPLAASQVDSTLRRADALLQAGKSDSAKSLYARLRGGGEGPLRAVVGLGRVALAERNWREALDLAKDGLNIDPASSACHYIAAIAEREIGTSFLWRNPHWKASRKHLERILERDSSFEDVLYQYAILERYNSCGEYIQERYNGYRDHALVLARAQIARTPQLVGPQLGQYKLFRYFMAVQDSAEFLEWARSQPGAVPRLFVGETLRRNGNLAGAESLSAQLLRIPSEVSPQAIRLARARLRFQQGDKAAAEAEYWRGLQELTTELGAAILFEDLKYIVSDAELNYYRSLDSLRAKQDFFRSFWNFRNPSLALKSNLRLQEHIRRCLVAEKQYEYYGFRTWFSSPDNELTFPKAFALNEEFNDMGLIYLRQGAPDDIVRRGHGFFDDDPEAAGSGGQIVSDNPEHKEDFQSWLYDPTAESPRMIFHFQKHRLAGNSWRLTGFPSFDRMQRQLAVWDPTFEHIVHPLGGELDRVNLETGVRVASKALVNYALSTDKQTWDKKISTFRFPHAIDVFRAPDGRSLLDISYAIPTATLARLLPDTAKSVPVEIGFSLVDARSRKAASDLDTFNLDLSRTRTGAIVDLIRYTVPPDSYAVSMHIRPLSGGILGSWKQTLRVSDYSRRGFMMSSIQFLRPSPEKGALEIDGVKVVQSPFRTHVRTEPLYLYFQIYNLIPDGDGNTSYAVECRLLPPGEDDWDKGIVIHRNQKSGKEHMAAEFYTIDVRTVSAGHYTLTMKITDRKRVETIMGARDIEILKP
jgi:GWxTD domain-containing protein